MHNVISKIIHVTLYNVKITQMSVPKYSAYLNNNCLIFSLENKDLIIENLRVRGHIPCRGSIQNSFGLMQKDVNYKPRPTGNQFYLNCIRIHNLGNFCL